jgi:hypothetical protein
MEMMRSPERRCSLARRALEFIATNNWDVKKEEYLALVDGLASKKSKRGTLGQIAP